MHRESRSPRSLIQVKEVSWGARARLLFPGERKHLIPEKLLLRGRAFPWSVGFAPFLRAYTDRSTFPGSVGDAMQFHRHFTDLRVSREDEFPAPWRCLGKTSFLLIYWSRVRSTGVLRSHTHFRDLRPTGLLRSHTTDFGGGVSFSDILESSECLGGNGFSVHPLCLIYPGTTKEKR